MQGDHDLDRVVEEDYERGISPDLPVEVEDLPEGCRISFSFLFDAMDKLRPIGIYCSSRIGETARSFRR